MKLGQSLLETSALLLQSDPRRPKQANLRRSLSTAYYALFHLLTAEVANLLTSERTNPTLHALLARTLDHGDMLRVCRSFQAGYSALSPSLRTLLTGIPADLQTIAGVFVTLQIQRHSVDYDPQRRLTRVEARRAFQQAQTAFAAWERAKRLPEAQTFLLALLFGQRWNRS